MFGSYGEPYTIQLGRRGWHGLDYPILSDSITSTSGGSTHGPRTGHNWLRPPTLPRKSPSSAFRRYKVGDNTVIAPSYLRRPARFRDLARSYSFADEVALRNGLLPILVDAHYTNDLSSNGDSPFGSTQSRSQRGDAFTVKPAPRSQRQSLVRDQINESGASDTIVAPLKTQMHYTVDSERTALPHRRRFHALRSSIDSGKPEFSAPLDQFPILIRTF